MQRCGVDLGRVELDAEFRCVFRAANGLSDVQQGFGGHAAVVQAHAAEGIARIDDDGLHAQFRSAKCRAVPRRPAADDDQIGFLCEFADDH